MSIRELCRWRERNPPDEFTEEEVTDGITEDDVFDTFVWMPDPSGDRTEAVVPETSLMLEPKVGYTNYFKSGTTVAANDEADNDLGGTTNRDTFTTNEVRDGGYWIFANRRSSRPVRIVVVIGGGRRFGNGSPSRTTRPRLSRRPRAPRARRGYVPVCPLALSRIAERLE